MKILQNKLTNRQHRVRGSGRRSRNNRARLSGSNGGKRFLSSMIVPVNPQEYGEQLFQGRERAFMRHQTPRVGFSLAALAETRRAHAADLPLYSLPHRL